MKFKFILILIFISLMSFSKKEKELIKQRIKIENHVLIIDIPNDQHEIGRYIGGHGISFDIKYPDNSLIFYLDDNGLVSPNYEYYPTINFKTLIGEEPKDTTISGEQPKGKFWKEKFFNGYSIGYNNVPKEKKDIFDKSLATFKKK